MAYTNPTATDFKAYFTRDFLYGSTESTVMDSDINKAIAQAAYNINQALFPSQSDYTMAFLYKTAHWLVTDLQMAGQGIGGQGAWFANSKTVGSVSESYSIPDKILNNPVLGLYAKTPYGQKYLTLILQWMTGTMFATRGITHS